MGIKTDSYIDVRKQRGRMKRTRKCDIQDKNIKAEFLCDVLGLLVKEGERQSAEHLGKG
jgi:hypothetical protein